jgi:hypothetical protein
MHLPLSNPHTAISQSPRPWDSAKHAVRDDTRSEAKDQTAVPSSPPLHLYSCMHMKHATLHQLNHRMCMRPIRIWIALTRVQGARTAVRTDVCGRSHNRGRRLCPHSPPSTAVGRTLLDPHAALMHESAKTPCFRIQPPLTSALTHSLTHCLVQLISTRTCSPHSTTTNMRTHSLPACFH